MVQPFRTHGLAGLRDRARPGAPVKYARRNAFCGSWMPRRRRGMPAGTAARSPRRWGCRPGVGRVGHRISLQRRRSWCVSTDPAFAAKAADVVGLYLSRTRWSCRWMKSPTFRRSNARKDLKLPNGRPERATSARDHDAVCRPGRRHGAGPGGHYHRRRRVDFLHFMNALVGAYPNRDLHIILDNLNIHKPKRDRWLARHPRVHLHYTPCQLAP